jgi:hypothetical protein
VVSNDLVTYDYLFDEKGNVLKSSSFGVNAPSDRIEDKPLSINDLSVQIKNYLDKEFKGWKFEQGIVFLQNGIIQIYNVLITYDKKEFSIQFDSKGNFIKKEQIGRKGNSDNNKYEIKNILPKDLPISISNYLNNKHGDFKYIQTAIFLEKNKKTYWITILKGNTTFDYTFEENGTLISVKEIVMNLPNNDLSDKPLDPKDIPNKAKEYLDINYKGWIFQKGKTIFAENKILGYSIAIKVGNDYYYINFDANANFTSARRG